MRADPLRSRDLKLDGIRSTRLSGSKILLSSNFMGENAWLKTDDTKEISKMEVSSIFI